MKYFFVMMGILTAFSSYSQSKNGRQFVADKTYHCLLSPPENSPPAKTVIHVLIDNHSESIYLYISRPLAFELSAKTLWDGGFFALADKDLKLIESAKYDAGYASKFPELKNSANLKVEFSYLDNGGQTTAGEAVLADKKGSRKFSVSCIDPVLEK